jgi:NitT/TauT family transport system ATP-binding protein
MKHPARPIVRVVNMGFGFGEGDGRTMVLEGVSFDVHPGEFLAVVGPSGVGKSTLLRVVAGLVHPDQGEVIVETFPEQGTRDFGFVFQDARLIPWRRVLGNVEYGLEGIVQLKADRTARAHEALALVGLSDRAGRWPHQLSGGQRQRTGLARALAVRPAILLMDEPFAALDPATRHALQDELLAIRAKSKTAVIFVTHDMNEATYLADRILVLGGEPACITRQFDIEIPHPRPRNKREEDGEQSVGGQLIDIFTEMHAKRSRR